MLIQDKVYGTEEINEPVLIDLIDCPTLQRLKRISQQGMPREYYHREIFSRFDHSTGVLILLRRLGADLYEQIAGLLHDISHTAFSHVIDWVIGDPSKEDHQDNIFLEVLQKSEVPFILEKHNIDINRISNLKSFSLLEQDAPILCADRIDYSLRELVDLGFKKKVKGLVNNLATLNGQIAFKTKEAAEEFGKIYVKLQREHWAGNEAKARYYILSEILKTALEEKYLCLEDFHKTDNEIIEILSKTNHKKIREELTKLKNGFIINKVESKNKRILLKKKFRFVDPEILVEGKLVNLSSVSLDYKKLIDKEKKHSKRKISIEISDIL
jgi:uncharacterized protein